MMGHAGMAALAVRRLRSTGAPASAVPSLDPLPRPELRAVRADERPPPAPEEFRSVLGHFASGVTVITAPGTEGKPPAGFACQSFSSLSLDPPLVVFMVARASGTWPRIARTGVFCVNILGSDQGALCRGFAVRSSQTDDKFAGVAYESAPATGSPRIEGVPAWIDCTIHAVHTAGDHLIVVGRVEALGADESAAGAGPLLFHRGTFGAFDGFGAGGGG
ncbi:flavin reductase family protein [Streptomyces sp. SCA3-4]|uniref:flavin reductase family protein n=1 Tax=Streptomyces sichuanensis TaxID=2871810 RepID=UPI001CE2A727|nr:flavin reductase family protein [Streptomyces sichuanensis]MCA6094753.1 flavin reductase family protein [Streptomyces sichuanensis]